MPDIMHLIKIHAPSERAYEAVLYDMMPQRRQLTTNTLPIRPRNG
jgi:hypothetical protein